MTEAGVFTGTWRIVEMELWDEDAFDLVGPAHFTFGKGGRGNFRFIAVEGEIDFRSSEMDGEPRVEFTWIGSDEGDQVSGRGWAVLDGDTIAGRIYFHNGDDSAFTAKRSGAEKSANRAKRNR